MAKFKQRPRKQAEELQNPVAKFMHQFNKAHIFQDKTRYQRKAKHKNLEPFPIAACKLSEMALTL